ncbi:PspC domain-containing protein [Nocardiopsis listeri]|uniref:PspC domain-containing protein n=1 Tax=Nocardiopsis listeri TaxID=53440 RepID=UPI001CC1E6DC|nr:PspC domain-containing protein [Nocardiopsis listeri]
MMTDGRSSDTPAAAEVPPEPGPELRRNDDHRVIAGVCAGLGAYTGIDPVLWRTGFVLTLFAGGTGLFLYVAAWVLMRDPQGGPATFEQMLDRAFPSRAVPKLLAVGLMAVTAMSLVGGFGWGTMILAIPLVLGLLTARSRGVDLRASFSGLRADLAEREPPPTGPAPQPSAAYYNPAQPWASAPNGPVDLAVVSERTSRDGEDTDGDDEDEDSEGGFDDGARGCRGRRGPRSSPLASFALWTVVIMAVVWVVVAPSLGSPYSEMGGVGLLFGPDLGIYFMAAATAVIGLFALIGAFAGNPRGLGFLGSLAVLCTLTVTMTDVTEWRAGGEVWRPESAAEAESWDPRLSLGEGTLDLSGLDGRLEPGQSVDVTARVDQGRLVVLIPDGMRVELEGHVTFGAVHTPEEGDDDRHGYDLTYEESFEPVGPLPRSEVAEVPVVNVETDTRVGVLEVRYDQARD